MTPLAQELLNTPVQIGILALCMSTLFFVYIRSRYDDIIDDKLTDLVKKKSNLLTYAVIACVLASFALMLLIRYLANPFGYSYIVMLVTITIAVVALEGSLFLIVAPRMR